MHGVVYLLVLAVACTCHAARHMETVHMWSEIDYYFPKPAERQKQVQDRRFIPGNSVPISVDVDAISGRVFISMPRFRPGNAASVATVSTHKGRNDEPQLMPYPDWSWHRQGDCDGITSVFRVYVDECRRLWVVDSATVGGSVDVSAGVNRICPSQLVIFDLTNDRVIKKFRFPNSTVLPSSVFTTIAVDVRDTANKCKNTFAYVADVSGFGLIVYDYAHDDAWRVTANEMYPYPPFGLFNIHGSQFDLMDGVLALALTPKKQSGERTLYFHSLASDVESWVDTALLRNKSNFAGGNNLVARQFHVSPGKRDGGQAGSEGFDDNGVLWFSVLPSMTINCWNSKLPYTQANIVEVDSDDEAFQFVAGVKVVKNTQGVQELWILSSRFQRHMVGTTQNTDMNYRVMKAPIERLAQGTSCAGTSRPAGGPIGGRPPGPGAPIGGGGRPGSRPGAGGSYGGGVRPASTSGGDTVVYPSEEGQSSGGGAARPSTNRGSHYNG